jgi:hypothetical protein
MVESEKSCSSICRYSNQNSTLGLPTQLCVNVSLLNNKEAELSKRTTYTPLSVLSSQGKVCLISTEFQLGNWRVFKECMTESSLRLACKGLIGLVSRLMPK